MSAKIVKDPSKVVTVQCMGSYRDVVNAARVSIGGQKPKSSDLKLLKYLWKNEHTSPFEHVAMTLKINCPIFTARQIMRHRTFSYNEISGRYSELDLGYYVPEGVYEQNEGNKQGYGNHLDDSDVAISDIQALFDDIDFLYRRFIADGMAREQARLILPVSTITSFYMTGNFLNWVKFLKLRLTEHAQFEVWTVALDVAIHLENNFPELWEIVKESVNGTIEQLSRSRHSRRLFT